MSTLNDFIYVPASQKGGGWKTLQTSDADTDVQFAAAAASFTGRLARMATGLLIRSFARVTNINRNTDGTYAGGTINAGDQHIGNTAPFTLHVIPLGAPVAKSTTKYHAAQALSTTTTLLTVWANPIDVARPIILTLSVDTIAGNVDIVGVDSAGNALTERIVLPGGAGVTFQSVNAYGVGGLTSVLLPIKTNSSGDTIAIGSNDTVGLNDTMYVPLVDKLIVGGVVQATDAVTQVCDGLVMSKNLIASPTAFDGSKQVIVNYTN